MKDCRSVGIKKTQGGFLFAAKVKCLNVDDSAPDTKKLTSKITSWRRTHFFKLSRNFFELFQTFPSPRKPGVAEPDSIKRLPSASAQTTLRINPLGREHILTHTNHGRSPLEPQVGFQKVFSTCKKNISHLNVYSPILAVLLRTELFLTSMAPTQQKHEVDTQRNCIENMAFVIIHSQKKNNECLTINKMLNSNAVDRIREEVLINNFLSSTKNRQSRTDSIYTSRPIIENFINFIHVARALWLAN